MEMTLRKLVLVLLVALVIVIPPHQAFGKSNSHTGHNAQTQNHPPVNHPGHHSDAAPAQPGAPGTGQNPGAGQPTSGISGNPGGPGPNPSSGPAIGLHPGPDGPVSTSPAGASYPTPPQPTVVEPPKAPVPPQALPPQRTPKIVQQTPTAPQIVEPPRAPVPPQALPPQRTPKIVQQTPTAPQIVEPPRAPVPSQTLPEQHTPQLVGKTPVPPAGVIPGGMHWSEIGHASVFQHQHALLPAKAPVPGETLSKGAVYLPPQVTHGVITAPAAGSTRDDTPEAASEPALYCLLPTVRADGSSFGGLLEPPPGWRRAQSATSAHVSLQGGANYIDPVLRSLPASHPPYSVCLVDLVVTR